MRVRRGPATVTGSCRGSMPLGHPGKASRLSPKPGDVFVRATCNSLAGGMVLRRLLVFLLVLAACHTSARRHEGPPARRIVSLLPSFTEILFAIGAGDRVVGRTTWCDYPPAALAVPSVGDGMPPNIEAVAARKPDLVVLYNSGPNVIAAQQLERIGIRTVLLDMNRLEDLGPATRTLGRLTGLHLPPPSAPYRHTCLRRLGQSADHHRPWQLFGPARHARRRAQCLRRRRDALVTGIARNDRGAGSPMDRRAQ